MTIEERAKDVVSKIHVCIESSKLIALSRRIMNALTEQDHISRQIQREKDIQRAKEWYCNRCMSGNVCPTKYAEEGCIIIENRTQAIKGE